MDNFVDAYNEFVLGAGTEEEGQSDILVIDNDLRTIAIPSDLLLGVESDESVNRLQFRMPRYYKDVDLSDYLIRINYMNANGDKDVYVVEDKEAGEEFITFSWLVGRVATLYKGKTAFVVCLRIVRPDYTISNEFNTTVHYLPVLEGLETTNAVIEEHPDLLEQLLVQLRRAVNAAEQEVISTGQQYVESAAASAASASDSATSASNSKNAAAASAADAATEKAEVYSAVEAVEDTVYDVDGLKDMLDDNRKTGGLITVEDAAPVTAKKVLLTLKPHQDLHGYDHPWPAGGGKNKFDYENTGISLVGITNTNGTFSNSTADSRSTFGYRVQAFNGSKQVVSNSLIVSSTGRKSITITISSEVTLLRIKHNGGTADLIVNYPWTEQGTFTVSLNVTGYDPSVVGGLVFNDVQIETGSSATDFAPYSNICPIEGYTGVEVERTGKNFIDEDTLYASFKTGTNAFSGTASAINLVQFNIPQELVGQKLTFSAHITSMGATNVRVYAEVSGTGINGNSGTAPFWSSVTFTPTSTSDKVQITFGSSGSGITVFDSVQLEIGSTRTTYEQYQGKQIIANICINQWDEEWEQGVINGSGVNADNNSRIRSKNYIPCKSNTTYYTTIRPIYIRYYDDNQEFVSIKDITAIDSSVFTTPSNAKYMRFCLDQSYGNVYKNDLSINYPASFTDYYPYTGNGVAYSGTIDLGTGEMVLDYKEFDLSDYTPSVVTSADKKIFYYSLTNPMVLQDINADGYAEKFAQYKGNNAWAMPNYSFLIRGDSGGHGVYINMDFTNAVTPSGNMVLPLTTPITIQLTPQQLHMLKGLNYVWTDADTIELDYYVDKDKKLVVVGNAEQLLSKEMVNDQEPYLFRASGGNGADREYDTLVGGTVCWNQLASELNAANWQGTYATATFTNGVADITVSASNLNCRIAMVQAQPFYSGHKYLMSYRVKSPKANSVKLGLGDITANFLSSGTLTVDTWTDVIGIVDANLDVPSGNIRFFPVTNTSAFSGGEVVSVEKIQAYDLTAMFGSTIADYAYSLEQATAGSGIAWLKKCGFFTKPYYPYNAGELMSVKALRHKMVGFNQWDEEWEVGSISRTTGAEVTNADCIRSKNYCPCIGGTTYRLTCKSAESSATVGIVFYDKDYNWVYGVYFTNQTSTIPENAAYFRIFTQTASGSYYGNVYKNDICINLSKTTGSPKNGDYVPYTTYEYPLDPKVTLQGIYKLNGDKLYCDGDKYYPDKGVERRYKLVDLGTIAWGYTSGGDRFTSGGISSVVKPPTSDSVLANIISPKFVALTLTELRNSADDNLIAIGDTGVISVRYTASGTDTAAFKTAMSGVYLLYELATPYFEQADPFEPLQVLDPYGTEEYVDDREVPIPVGHDTNYPANLRAEVERMMKQIPVAPANNGTYVLKVTVTAGVPSYEWVVE